MRILNLRLKNLNSLVGEWCIDFTHPDYESNGIFAIIGPTGAGKSTLLDAICLALYGKTPRLDRISKSSNEIMARQTGECFAEVTFETARGKYRCHWGQHRSHKKAGGELQNAQREIVDAVTEKVLENYSSRVDAKIEEITGMDFQRFTRSMLLAQGGFDAFLKASPSERAPILEQITGTEIYSKISIAVFERSKKESKKLEDLQNNLAAIQVLSHEDENCHIAEFNEKSEAKGKIDKKLLVLNEQKVWRLEVDRISADLKGFRNKWDIYVTKENAAHTDLKRLELALKALDFEGDYRDLNSLKQNQKRDLDSLSGTIAEKSITEKSITEKENAYIKSQKEFEDLLEKQRREVEVFTHVRQIDSELKIECQKLNELSKRIESEDKNVTTYKHVIEKHQKANDKHATHLKELQLYFEGHACNESLIEKFSSIKENLDRFKEIKRTIESKNIEYNTSLEQLEEAKSLVAVHLKAYDAAKVNSVSAENLLKTISDDFEVISEGKDFLQWAEEKEALGHKEKFLGEFKTTVLLYDNSEQKQKAILEAIQGFKEKLIICRENEKVALVNKEKTDKKIEELQHQQELQNRLQSLDVERTRLSDEHPCPLCGSLEHPYAYGNIPDLRKVDEELNKARLESKELAKTYHKLDKEISTIESEIQSCNKSHELEVNLSNKYNEETLRLLELLDCDKESFATVEKSLINQFEEFKQKYNAYLNKSNEKENVQKKFNTERKKYTELEMKRNVLLEKQSSCATHSGYLNQEVIRVKSDHEELESLLLEAVRVYGIFTFVNSDPSIIKEGLQQRLNEWKQQQALKKQVEETLLKVVSEINVQKIHLESTENTFKCLSNDKRLCNGDVEKLKAKRQHLFGNKNTDSEEDSLKMHVESVRLRLDGHKSDFSKMQQQLENLTNRIIALNNATQDAALTLQTKERNFIEQIFKIGFSDLDTYRQASLAREERESLNKLKNSLESEKSILSAEIKTAENRFSELNIQPKTDQSLIVLNEQIFEITQLKDDISERVLILKTKLAENEKKKEAANIIQGKIVQQTKETDICRDLSSLIGAADGKKFRDFAQKMTLEMMIAQANRQLMKMSDRYLLKQSSDFPLELDVVDNYQAGEERSVKNLSGGEGFIVSLSLALGLSQMSSSKVRVDSLFLDEGFGTLDERALEVALDTLSELHQDGKVIGLISHVTVLKERISTQIKVQPISGGRSRIEGPGCMEIKKV